MKRIPLIGSFILFIALCVSIAYWAMQFFQPPPRAIVSPPSASIAAPELSAAATLLGGGHGTAASNFQLTGIILADKPGDSLAIIAIDGKPAKPIRIHAEISPGVSVQEIQRGFVLLSDHGANKRLDLPVKAKDASIAITAPNTPPLPSGVSAAVTAPLPATANPNVMFNHPGRHTGGF